MLFFGSSRDTGNPQSFPWSSVFTPLVVCLLCGSCPWPPMGTGSLHFGHSSTQNGILLLSWDTWYDLSMAGIRPLPKGLEASKSQISPMVSFTQVGYLYLPLRNRRHSLTDHIVFKSFVYAPSPRLLKLKTSFSKTVSFSFHARPSLRKMKPEFLSGSMAESVAITGHTGEHQEML